MNMPPRKRHPFSVAHRWSGIITAVLVLLVSATGLLLNHSEDLRLSKRTVQSGWLLDWYGIAENTALQSFNASGQAVSQLGRSIYVDGEPVADQQSTLQGAVMVAPFLVIATSEQLLLLAEGQIAEILSAVHGVPRGIRRVGTDPSGLLIIEAEQGIWRANAELLDWEPVEVPHVSWSTPAPVSTEISTRISRHYRGAGLPLERVVLDLHSGRILGKGGPWLGDALAVMLMLLAVTGIWMWFKGRKR